MAGHCEAIVAMQDAGAIAFDYGNNLRAFAQEGGFGRPFAYPGFVPAFIRDQFSEGRGPFRCAALPGDPDDVYRTGRALLEPLAGYAGARLGLSGGTKPISFPGPPAPICWLGYGERDRAGLLCNGMVASAKLKAPTVIGRDPLDSGSVASAY